MIAQAASCVQSDHGRASGAGDPERRTDVEMSSRSRARFRHLPRRIQVSSALVCETKMAPREPPSQGMYIILLK